MKTIDHSNLDEWLFDYFEGNLTLPEKEKLTCFLNKNPALKADYDSWKNSYINETEIAYPGANNLLKPKKTGINWFKWPLYFGIVFLGLISYLFYMQTIADNPAERIDTKNSKKEITSPAITNKKSNITSEKIGKTKREDVVLNKTINEKQYRIDATQNDSILVPDPMITNSIFNVIESQNNQKEGQEVKIYNMEHNKNMNEVIKDTSDRKSKKTKKQMKIIRLKNTGF